MPNTPRRAGTHDDHGQSPWGHERDLPGVPGQIRQQTALVRAMTHGTIKRDELCDYARIGTFLERADKTARILDVKYCVLLPTARAVGNALDNVDRETIPRSESARGGCAGNTGPRPERWTSPAT